MIRGTFTIEEQVPGFVAIDAVTLKHAPTTQREIENAEAIVAAIREACEKMQERHPDIAVTNITERRGKNFGRPGP